MLLCAPGDGKRMTHDITSALTHGDGRQPASGTVAWPDMASTLREHGYRILGTPGRFIGRRGSRLVLPGDLLARLRAKLFESAGGVCLYCRIGMRRDGEAAPDELHRAVTIEHRLPLARGGTWKRSNLAGACARCNAAKGDLTEGEYLPLVAAHPPDRSGKNFGRLRRAARALQAERGRALHVERLAAAAAVSETDDDLR